MDVPLTWIRMCMCTIAIIIFETKNSFDSKRPFYAVAISMVPEKQLDHVNSSFSKHWISITNSLVSLHLGCGGETGASCKSKGNNKYS